MSEVVLNPVAALSSGSRRTALELLRLALPLIAVSTSRMLMQFIDFVMVSGLGTEAQAAVSPATLLMWACICLGVGMLTSVQTFASQADGRGEPEEGAAYAWQSLPLGLAFGVLVAPLTWLVPGLYAWIGEIAQHAPAVQRLETEYTRVVLWSIAPATIAVGLESYFNGLRRPRVTLVAVLAALGTNALGNWLLIWGKFGLPQMGIAGAALATVVGWWVRALVLLAVFVARRTDERYHTRRAWRPSLVKIRGIVRIGGPTGAAWLADIASWVVFLNLIVPPFGTVSLAATNIALQYTHLAFMPAIGLGLALCSQVGFAIGAGRPHEAEERTRTALWLTMAYMGGIGLLLYLLRGPLLGLMSKDAAVVAAGAGIMLWVALYQVFDAMSITFIFALRGAGDTRTVALLNAGCCWLIFILGGWAVATLRPEWGVNGPWALAVAYLTVLGLSLLARWRSGAWKAIRVFAEPGGLWRPPIAVESKNKALIMPDEVPL
ncbi:MAG: MATE family efflux transporter [Planctomycetota bacterium]